MGAFLIDNTIKGQTALQAAVSLLSKRDYSRIKLITKLIQKGFQDDEIQEAIEILVQRKLFDEAHYIEARIKGLAKKSQAPLLIKEKLKREGLNLGISSIRDVFKNEGIHEKELILKLIEKKIRQKPEISKQKIFLFLRSKGYDSELILECLN